MIRLAALQNTTNDTVARKTQALASAQYLDLEFLDISKAISRPKTLAMMSTEELLSSRDIDTGEPDLARRGISGL